MVYNRTTLLLIYILISSIFYLDKLSSYSDVTCELRFIIKFPDSFNHQLIMFWTKRYEDKTRFDFIFLFFFIYISKIIIATNLFYSYMDIYSIVVALDKILCDSKIYSRPEPEDKSELLWVSNIVCSLSFCFCIN